MKDDDTGGGGVTGSGEQGPGERVRNGRGTVGSPQTPSSVRHPMS